MSKNVGLIFLSLLFIFLIFVIGLVFSGHIILPQTFSLGPLTVHYYGIIMALAVFAAFFLGLKRASQYQVSEKQAEDLMFWLIIGGFLGARFYHVITDLGYYIHNPIDIFKVWQGGLGIYGALIGGLVTLLICKKIFNLQSSIFNLLDWLAPSVLLGQIIGRFGNFFNYELYGYPTNLPWKMFVPVIFRPPAYTNFNFFHPVFLYEALGNFLILMFLLKLSKILNPSQPPLMQRGGENSPTSFQKRGLGGVLFFSYLLLYNILRFSTEFLKTDSQYIGLFRLNVVAGFILIFFSAAVIFKLNKKRWKNTTNLLQ